MSWRDRANWWAARHNSTLKRSARIAFPVQSQQRRVETKCWWPERLAEAVEIDARMGSRLAYAKDMHQHMLRIPPDEAVALDEEVLGARRQADRFGNECEGHCGV